MFRAGGARFRRLVSDGGDRSALPGEFSQDVGLADARQERNREKRDNIEDSEPERGRLVTAIIFHIDESSVRKKNAKSKPPLAAIDDQSRIQAE